MTAAPHATRMTTNAIAGELELLAREARDIAETAARFARDVDTALTCGDAGRIAQEAQSLLLRATRVTAMRETADLFTAELNPEVTP